MGGWWWRGRGSELNQDMDRIFQSIAFTKATHVWVNTYISNVRQVPWACFVYNMSSSFFDVSPWTGAVIGVVGVAPNFG